MADRVAPAKKALCSILFYWPNTSPSLIPTCSYPQFCEMKQDERSNKENTVSLVVGGKTLYLFNLFDPDNPIELAFQAGFLSRSGGWHRKSRIYTEEKAKVVIAVWGTELFPIPCRA